MKMQLNSDNYYTLEADRSYCSVSQYKMAMGSLGKPGCEYQYIEYLSGRWQREITKDLLIGSYVDSRYEGSIEKFKSEHPELFVSRGERKGDLKAEYVKAEEIYQRCEKDRLFSLYMSGEKQVIMTGEIDGLPFKIKMDSLHRGKCIVDLKVMENLTKTFWTRDFGYTDFIRYWGYDVQLAVYREIYRQNTGELLPCFICAADKGKYTNIEVIQIPNIRLDEALQEVKSNIPTMIALRNGEYEPVRCGVCGCCIKNKVLEHPISQDELLLEV